MERNKKTREARRKQEINGGDLVSGDRGTIGYKDEGVAILVATAAAQAPD